MVPCAEVRPLAIAEAAALGDLFPCQPLHSQFIRTLVALAGLDDMRLSCHATHSRAVLLRPAGGLEGAPALGIPTQARSEHLVAHTNHKRLDRLQRCNRARRRFPDGSHSLPVRVEHVNSRIISTPDAPRTWRLATRPVQIVSLNLSHSVPPPARPPYRHGASGTGVKRIFTDNNVDCPRVRFPVRSRSWGPARSRVHMCGHPSEDGGAAAGRKTGGEILPAQAAPHAASRRPAAPGVRKRHRAVRRAGACDRLRNRPRRTNRRAVRDDRSGHSGRVEEPSRSFGSTPGRAAACISVSSTGQRPCRRPAAAREPGVRTTKERSVARRSR